MTTSFKIVCRCGKESEMKDSQMIRHCEIVAEGDINIIAGDSIIEAIICICGNKLG